MLGTVIDPQAAYAIGRGLKTLAVRIQRHNANAMAVAQLAGRTTRRVERVYYPGLESHPDHALAATADDAASAGWSASTWAAARSARSGSSIG